MAPAVRFRLGRLAFTWDEGKCERNLRKHGITFEEAATTWLDPCAIETVDAEHSEHEDRWLRIGMSLRGVLLITWSTERETVAAILIRIIGARRATTKEQRLYDKAKTRRRV